MEERPTSLLIGILEKNEKCQVDIGILEKYYQLFENRKYLGNDFEKIYNDMKNTYSIDLQSLKYGYDKNAQIIYQSLILAVINETDIKKKIKLIPLIIYLDSNRILYDYLHDINYFIDFVFDIKDFFVNTIEKSEVKISNIEKLPSYHQEREWFENYQKGIKSLDFKQIYSFVDGVNSGLGDKFDIYMDFLVFIVYRYFFDDLVKIANSKKDIFEVLYLINILNIEETLNLACSSNNYHLKFESIRKSVYFKSNNSFCLNLLKNERDLITKIIIEFSSNRRIWQNFLEFYLEFPSRSVQLFEPMSKAILHVNNDSIDDLVNILKINEYFNEDSKEALNSLVLNIKDENIKKEILEKLFYRWNNYIDNYRENIGSIILTNIIDIVIIYIKEFLDKDLAIKNINKILNDLDEINNFWFKDRQEQNNFFYKQMSKLFVFSFILDKYQSLNIKEKILMICNSNQILKKEQTYQTKTTTLQLFNKYIFEDDNK